MTLKKANNTIQKKNDKIPFQAFMKNDVVLKNIYTTLGSETRGKKFVSALISAVSTNPALAECEATTIVSGALLGEALNLSPSPQLGHYYLVPFKDNNRGITTATFQLGYKGYLQLAIRSGQYKKINVLAIKEGELVGYNPLDEEIDVALLTDEEERENAETVGYYAMFELVNGFRKTMYWSKQKMYNHALKYSKGFKNDVERGWKYTFWSKDFDSMAFKTMLRQLISKWGIMSIEMQNAYVNDMSFKDEQGQNVYVDNDFDTDFVIANEVIDVNEETGEVIQEKEEVKPTKQTKKTTPKEDTKEDSLF